MAGLSSEESSPLAEVANPRFYPSEFATRHAKKAIIRNPQEDFEQERKHFEDFDKIFYQAVLIASLTAHLGEADQAEVVAGATSTHKAFRIEAEYEGIELPQLNKILEAHL